VISRPSNKRSPAQYQTSQQHCDVKMQNKADDALPLIERLKLASYFHAGFELEKDDVKWVYNALKQLRVGQPSKRSDNSAE